MSIKVHQFHSGSAYGDAVTNSMLLLQRHLRALGLQSEVFAEHLDPLLGEAIRPHTDLDDLLAPDDVLIIHHSMGHDRINWLLGLRCRKVLLYHNITPASFFPVDSAFHKYSLLGYEQLGLLMRRVERAYAVSEFNARDMRKHGFQDVKVLPVLVDDAKYEGVLRPRCLETDVGRPWTVLFVGRVCQNKGHRDLIDAASHWIRHYPQYPVQFVCVGAYSRDDAFYQELRSASQQLGLDNVVTFTGKVSDDELRDWYARADCYLSLSQHEGFGVPLIEAMLCRLPVLALSSSAVSETMGGAGVLLSSADGASVCAALLRLMRNRPFRRQVVTGQLARVAAFRSDVVRVLVVQMLAELRIPCGIPSPVVRAAGSDVVRIEGPCDSSYSLAIVNREMAGALDEAGTPSALFCTEGPGDYSPSEANLATLTPRTRELIRRGDAPAVPKATIRNLYPPRVRDERGDIAAGYFFWEESSFPPVYVRDFNLSLDVLLAPSRFVADTWRSSGVNVPIRYVGSGADHVMRVPAEPLPIKLPEGFRFLHVSSCFPRKGPDVLLRAFGRAFDGRQDVVLVIKTFPNPHNRVPEMLEALRRERPGFPAVVVINEDYSAGRIRTLYETCQAYVAPSRGEGFGLPMAEAMLHDLPVVATGWGGHVDFCTPDTSYPIRYTLAPSTSHVAGQSASLWAEPDEDHLVELLQRVERERGEPAKIAAARQLIEHEFSWNSVARRVEAAIEPASLPGRDFSDEPLRMAWVSTWNEACGIATYSKYLLDHADRSELEITMHGRKATSCETADIPMSELWRDASEVSLDALRDRIIADGAEVAVIQFNFGFFNVRALSSLTAALEKAGVRVIITLHSTRDVDRPDFKASLRDGIEGLSRASRLLVHSVEDLNRLGDLGLGARAALFPHGAMDLPTRGMAEARRRLEIPPAARIIASYGFMLPHKGLPELVDAFAALRARRDDVYLFMVNSLYPADVSRELRDALLAKIEKLGLRDRIRMFTDFLPEPVSLALLESANVVVFPYQETAESASGAVRFGLAARRPVATTPLAIFDDLEGQGLRFEGCTSRAFNDGLSGWIDDPSIESVVAGQNEWISARSWPLLMQRIADMARGLVQDEQG
ncbi:glycosyltransferase family 4 protein [Lysobacter arvi]|uniref:Glycosyltransferase n=1 Tax=Lysobacter arvi TaxID=3038776 RepID=A0ABU1CFA7_9GAMM|nr:glycosyltransferase [Lysobacter arvi]MDR0183637.1 glycosyltransferase [Lysobacter arvi]